MLLSDVEARPTESLRYLERYVNDGSPSGFTEAYAPSDLTRPFGDVSNFPLFAGFVPDEQVEDFGQVPPWLRSGMVPLHPDMADEDVVRCNMRAIGPTSFTVSPTASGRTVEVLGNDGPKFIKLTYNRLLGRVNRQISRDHALSALEITSILDQAARSRALPPQFGYLRESSARIAMLTQPDGQSYEWGTVFREASPSPAKAIQSLIPVFALFGVDRRQPDDALLVHQLSARQGLPHDEYLFANILAPLVSSYFEMLLRFGLQFECNAQNVLMGFDAGGTVTQVVLRDFESVDKDLSLVGDLGLGVNFETAPFKCVHRGLYNYAVKHSFMYDFKLGEYVLTPLISTVPRDEARRGLTNQVRDLARTYVERLPPGFFPSDGQWYSYANVVVDKSTKRPYVPHPDPTYR